MWSVSSRYFTILDHLHRQVDRLDEKCVHILKLPKKLLHRKLSSTARGLTGTPSCPTRPAPADRVPPPLPSAVSAPTRPRRHQATVSTKALLWAALAAAATASVASPALPAVIAAQATASAAEGFVAPDGTDSAAAPPGSTAALIRESQRQSRIAPQESRRLADILRRRNREMTKKTQADMMQ